jgi:Uncharacterized protein conserved in bacteria (DUF2252)
MHSRAGVFAASLLFAGGLTLPGCVSTPPRPAVAAPRAASETPPPWLPDTDAAQLPPALLAALRASPYAYFRFVNTPWASRVCEAFASDPGPLLRVQLHGDAHLEQYAFTRSARGLDDFDDSAQGPPTIDLVRFIGSLQLATRERGWTDWLDGIIDEFFRGYRMGAQDPTYLPETPAIVTRLRPKVARDRSAFLAWAERLMVPASPELTRAVRRSLARLARDPRLPLRQTGRYLRLKKLGTLYMGIGSYRVLKILMRVEGPSPADDDDVILEAKQLSDLSAIDCLRLPPRQESIRVIAGVRQLGRLYYDMLSVVPFRGSGDAKVEELWVRSWDPTYGEVSVPDFASVDELREVAHDVGAQLGSTGAGRRAGGRESSERLAVLRAVTAIEPRVRIVAHELTDDLIGAWEEFRITNGRVASDK